MEHLCAASFALAGVINIIPVTGVLGAARLQALYGMPFSSGDLLLLMQHRAVMLGSIGGLLLTVRLQRADCLRAARREHPMVRPPHAVVGF